MKEPTVEQLAATLAAHDLPLLRTEQAVPPLPLDPPSLIAALARHPDGRLGEALITLFLRHPAYARHVPAIVEHLPDAAARRLQHLYTAAVYLQRLWHGLLGSYLGPTTWLPDYFGRQVWCLPDPTVHFGEAGLRELARQLTAETGDNWLSTYDSALSLLLTYLHIEATDAA